MRSTLLYTDFGSSKNKIKDYWDDSCFFLLWPDCLTLVLSVFTHPNLAVRETYRWTITTACDLVWLCLIYSPLSYCPLKIYSVIPAFPVQAAGIWHYRRHSREDSNKLFTNIVVAWLKLQAEWQNDREGDHSVKNIRQSRQLDTSESVVNAGLMWENLFK